MPGIIFRHKPDDLVKSHEFSSNVNPRNTKCIPVVKIFALTRGVHAPRPTCPASRDPITLSCGIALELEQKFAFFKGLPLSMQTADFRIAFAWFKELIQKGRTNTFFTYPTENP